MPSALCFSKVALDTSLGSVHCHRTVTVYDQTNSPTTCLWLQNRVGLVKTLTKRKLSKRTCGGGSCWPESKPPLPYALKLSSVPHCCDFEKHRVIFYAGSSSQTPTSLSLDDHPPRWARPPKGGAVIESLRRLVDLPSQSFKA